jgi:glycosyltransferase involved in cell wall biosynthesis
VRTPFLSVELARFAERLPGGVLYARKRGKVILREVAYRYLPRKLVDLPKQGFGLPMSQWGARELLDVARELLESDESRLRAWLGSGPIDRFMKRQRRRQGFSTYQVWSVAMLESWLRYHPGKLPRAELPVRDPPIAVAGGEALAWDPVDLARDLVALPLASNIFAIAEDTGVQDHSCEGDESTRLELGGDAFQQLLRMTASYPEANERLLAGDVIVARRDLIPLKGHFGRAVLDLAPAERESFRGAVLLIVQPSIARRLGWSSLEGLRRVGVSAIVFSHPYRGDQSICRVRLNCRSAGRQLVDALRLARHGFGRWRLVKAGHQGGARFGAGPFPEVPPLLDRELSDRYMLFEGLRQMPPVPVEHRLIESAGDGRYSIWNQNVFFARSAPSRRWLFPRWVIENNSLTAPYLQFVPELHADSGQFLAQLKAHIAADRDAPRRLELAPGDPIVVLTHALPPGGAERQWCYLAGELMRLGYRVTFVVTDELQGEKAHYLPLLHSNDIPVEEIGRQSFSHTLPGATAGGRLEQSAIWFSSPFGVQLVKLVALLKRIAPKALFAQLDYPNLLAGTAGVLAEVPRIVFSFRNYNPTNFSYLRVGWFLPLYQALVGSARVRLSGNAHLANDDYADWIGVPRERVQWIANALEASDLAVPDEASIRALRTTLGIADGTPVVLGVFRMSEEKRPLLFVEVCAELTRCIPGLRVLMVGVGPLADAVQQRIGELGLERTINMLGRRSDVSALMLISSVLLLTSSFEGMPNVVMEAQVLGLPVVATRTGGAPECIRHGHTGFLVEVEDTAGYVKSCEKLLGEPEMGRRFGVEARMWASQQFARRPMAQRYLDLLGAEVAVAAGEPPACERAGIGPG